MALRADEEGPSFLGVLGSLFGGGPKIVRPAFSSYGKLPIYKDFLRHGLASREAQAFRQWLDRGFSRHWDAHEACRDHPIEPHAFSLRFEGLARRIVGCLWGSHDQGELRRFPFTIFVSLPASGAFGDLSCLDALGKVADSARELRQRVREVDDVQTFYQRVRETSTVLRLERDTAVRERLTREASGLTVREFAESLYGDGAAARWPALLAYLGRRRAASRSPARDGASPPLACRLPVSPLLPVLLQAEVWVSALLGSGAKGKTPMNVLLPWGSDPAGGIMILERDLRLDDVLAFHPDPAGHDLLEDLRREVPGGAAPLPADRWERPLSSLTEPGAFAAAGG